MIYLLEDDDSIRKLVVYALESQGLRCLGFPLPSLFYKAVELERPDLVLLDVMLPEEDGYSVLRKLRSGAATRETPVMMLTAKSAEYDRVLGLDSGADDYLVKPFGMMELTARVRALLRRAKTSVTEEEYTAGSLYVSPVKRIVTVAGKDVPLTYKEFEILCLLLENRGRVISRNMIMDRVWGEELDRENRTLDVHIRTLRSKLGEAGALVETVRGVGYKIGNAV